MTDVPASPRPEVRPLSFETRGLMLRGTAYVPKSVAPGPTVVMCHGFTGNRIETGRLFVTLARQFVQVGLGVVAVDRAGHGESDGEFFDTNITNDLADTHQTLDRIASFDFVDRDNLHLLGFSLGAVIASVVAAETSHSIRSLTLWSPAAVFADNARAGGLPGQPNPTQLEDGGFDFEGLRLGPRFREAAADFDPYRSATGYRGPVRILHGAQDFIPVEYAERYRDVYTNALRLTIVDGADHTWSTVRVREFLLEETVRFVSQNASEGEIPE